MTRQVGLDFRQIDISVVVKVLRSKSTSCTIDQIRRFSLDTVPVHVFVDGDFAITVAIVPLDVFRCNLFIRCLDVISRLGGGRYSHEYEK